jgi:hypothetical protein
MSSYQHTLISTPTGQMRQRSFSEVTSKKKDDNDEEWPQRNKDLHSRFKEVKVDEVLIEGFTF